MIPGFDWLQHEFMLQALLACTAMGLLLAYLGIHVVGRGIVFVDLALGQISSMGIAFAAYAGYNPMVCSMVATLAGAALCSRLRVRDPRLRLEAVIGVFYAVSSAITVLLIAKTPHGESDIQDVLFGNVLALEAGDVRTMLGVFAGVAVAHLLLGRQFFALTYRKGGGEELTPRDQAFNLLFYVLLAFAIVFAIRAGGVIPVFAFLILPPVAAVSLAKGHGAVIAIALLLAAAGCLVGLDLSYDHDLPAGASIVATLGILGLFVAVVGAVRRRWRGRGATAALVLLCTVGLHAFASAPAEAQATTPANAVSDANAEAVARELAALRAELAEARARVEEIEGRLDALGLDPAGAATLAAEPAEAPSLPPSQPAPATPDSIAVAAGSTPAPAASPAPARGLKLLDLALDGLFTAGASEFREGDYRELEAGGHDPKNRGFTTQNVELTLAGVIDPYLRGDAYVVLQIDEDGETVVELEEAFLTTLALPAGLQVKAGTFYSSFGRQNNQHPHAWAFADAPVVSSRLLGPDGLRGPGASLAWLVPAPFYVEATFGVQNSNGETAVSFRGEEGEELAGRLLGASEVRTFDDMLQLGRVATSFDLTSSLTIVPAVSYIRGPNATGPGASTSILGFDFYGKWKPLSNDHGWPFVTLQAEWMQRDLDAAAQELEDGTILPSEQLVDRGLYLQGTWGFTRRWVAGLRFDWFEGDESPYTDRALDPLRDRRERWSTNLSFFPSEFSKLRLQYNWDDSEFFDADGSSLVLQFEYLYGAHGGHKF